jgi:hypothetical protein
LFRVQLTFYFIARNIFDYEGDEGDPISIGNSAFQLWAAANKI